MSWLSEIDLGRLQLVLVLGIGGHVLKFLILQTVHYSKYEVQFDPVTLRCASGRETVSMADVELCQLVILSLAVKTKDEYTRKYCS